MSYHYQIEPSIVIFGDDLKNLNYHLNNKSYYATAETLSDNGYYSVEENLSPEEIIEFTGELNSSTEWVNAVRVYSLGWTPEYKGLLGIVEQFNKFAKFAGYNFPHGEYAITDDYDQTIKVKVHASGCYIVH